jgi:hypothetical protein
LFFNYEQGAGPLHRPPNLEVQVIFGQGFLPLALDQSISNCQAAVLFWSTLGTVFSWYPQFLVSIPASATWGGARWETSNFSLEKQGGMAFAFQKTVMIAVIKSEG